jgi:hypothetical protein
MGHELTNRASSPSSQALVPLELDSVIFWQNIFDHVDVALYSCGSVAQFEIGPTFVFGSGYAGLGKTKLLRSWPRQPDAHSKAQRSSSARRRWLVWIADWPGELKK